MDSQYRPENVYIPQSFAANPTEIDVQNRPCRDMLSFFLLLVFIFDIPAVCYDTQALPVRRYAYSSYTGDFSFANPAFAVLFPFFPVFTNMQLCCPHVIRILSMVLVHTTLKKWGNMCNPYLTLHDSMSSKARLWSSRMPLRQLGLQHPPSRALFEDYLWLVFLMPAHAAKSASTIGNIGYSYIHVHIPNTSTINRRKAKWSDQIKSDYTKQSASVSSIAN